MRLLHKVMTGLIVALGCLHIGLTPFNFDRFDMYAMWFVGTGVAIILSGFLNVAVIREAGKDPVVRTLCVIANASFVLLFAVALFQVAQPQVFVGLALFGVAGVCALFTRSCSEKDSP